jgi:hypothetical protein
MIQTIKSISTLSKRFIKEIRHDAPNKSLKDIIKKILNTS